MNLNPRALLGAGTLFIGGLAAALLPASAWAGATLKIVQGSGEFQTLETTVTVTTPRSLTLQWTTDQPTASGARWEVSDITPGLPSTAAPGRIGGGPIVVATPPVVASGEVSPAPKAGYHAFIVIPASAFLKSPSTATALKFNIRLTPQDAAHNPVGAASPAVLVAQVPDVAPPPLNFGESAKYPLVEIVSYDDKLGNAPMNQPRYNGADVTVRVSNKSGKASDPVWLSLKDSNLLMRQNTSKVYVPALAAGASQLVKVHLDVTLSPGSVPMTEQQLHLKWGEQHREVCGVDLRSLMDWAGPANNTPMDNHQEAFLVKEGWSDYAKLPANTPICEGKRCVRVCDLEKNIRARLDGHVVGYSFFAGQYPRFVGGGLARTAADGTAQDFTSSTKTTVASVSKFVTAVAAVAILDKHQVSLDAPIGPYLPADWTATSSYIRNLTFTQLLSQQSGIRVYGNVSQDYAELKRFFTQSVGNTGTTPCQGSNAAPVSRPITPADMSWCYSNYNFAIMRVLLPKVAGYAEDANPATRPQTLANQYVALVQQNVFDKVGRTGVACKPPVQNPGASTYAFGHKSPDSTAKGADWGDASLVCGAAGWYLSAEDLAKVLLSLDNRDGKILSADKPDRMADLRKRGLGLDVNVYDEIEKNGGWVANCDANNQNCDVVSTSVAIFNPAQGKHLPALLFLNSAIVGGPNDGQGAKQVLEDARKTVFFFLP